MPHLCSSFPVSQFHIYATRSDILAVLSEVEAWSPIKYVRAGYADTRLPETYATAADIPELGKTRAENWGAATRYLILPKQDDAVAEEKVFDGIVRYEVFAGINPTAVELSPSGILREGFLMYGRVASMDMTAEAKRMQRKMSSICKRRFRRVGYALVGGEAYHLLESGWRLSQAVQNPAEYALPIPGPAAVSQSDKV
jgi:hypothetical protein